MTRTMFDMTNPFPIGTEVRVSTDGTGNYGRVGTVEADDVTSDPGRVLVRLHGDPYSMAWHWSHFVGVDALTGENVKVLTSLPRVPCPDCIGYPCECGMAGGF